MGLTISRVFRSLFFFARLIKKEMRILIVGLDGAGKTTILYRMKLSQVVDAIPTIGFNVETVEYKNISFTVWDVGGSAGRRQFWRHYYANTQAVIYVVDSGDRLRQAEARHELHSMLQEEELRGAALLVFANKQDLPGSMKEPEEFEEGLDLPALREKRPLHLQRASAVTGEGLVEGLEWLFITLTNKSIKS
ncbi:hypothetical protein Mapa_006659 [Marchantia paleacea]|nr:hypothetical protein Mapa_006659 [Marchantia paleacea]